MTDRPPRQPAVADSGGAPTKPRRAARPKAVADDARRLLAWQYRGRDLLDKLALVTDRDNTLYRLLWAFALDGTAVLSEDERAFIGDGLDPAGQLKPWGRLSELLVEVCNDPEVQSDEEVYKLADLFARLAALCEMSGSGAIVARALDLAQAQRGAAAPTRSSGEDNRLRVKQAWLADIAAGGVERGRAGRCARRLKLPDTTVKSVVIKLRQLGQIPPANR